MNNNFKKIETTGRLFFCSDLHGELPTLISALKILDFKEGVDTLVCAGDLQDRGRYNIETVEFFTKATSDSYHSVLGNHDKFCFDTTEYNQDYVCWMINGGQWGLSLSEDKLEDLAHHMSKLPHAIEVHHKGLVYGVVHAGVPEELTWNDFIQVLSEDNAAAKQECVWMRDFVEYSNHEHYSKNYLLGVDYSIHGHCVVKEPLMVANRLHIDTGLVYGKYLTVTEALGNGEFKHSSFEIEG